VRNTQLKTQLGALRGRPGTFGWRRVVLIRRVVAGGLVVGAVVLAIRDPQTEGRSQTVLVTARDVAPGSALSASDIQVRRWPADLVPKNALHSVDQATGRVLAGAAGAGELLTSHRLAGPELARRARGRADAVSVPIRLVDADIAGLLNPGQKVDVITVGSRSDQPTILASGAIVLTVLPDQSKIAAGRGRLVLIAVPGQSAAKLAAATLSQEVTVTLR
jgi:Flp pilus assembly protein CpaB